MDRLLNHFPKKEKKNNGLEFSLQFLCNLLTFVAYLWFLMVTQSIHEVFFHAKRCMSKRFLSRVVMLQLHDCFQTVYLTMSKSYAVSLYAGGCLIIVLILCG